jgi:hypothetical protein
MRLVPTCECELDWDKHGCQHRCHNREIPPAHVPAISRWLTFETRSYDMLPAGQGCCQGSIQIVGRSGDTKHRCLAAVTLPLALLAFRHVATQLLPWAAREYDQWVHIDALLQQHMAPEALWIDMTTRSRPGQQSTWQVANQQACCRRQWPICLTTRPLDEMGSTLTTCSQRKAQSVLISASFVACKQLQVSLACKPGRQPQRLLLAACLWYALRVRLKLQFCWSTLPLPAANPG